MNQFTAGAIAREAHVRSHRAPRRSHAAHVLRAVAVVTTVLILWAVSYVASYAWLAPALIGAGR